MSPMSPRLLKTAAIGAATLLLIACSSPEEKAQNYYKSGAELLAKQDFAKASVEFRNALKLKKDFPDAWFGMAQIEEQAQNWPNMVGDLNRVLELNPKYTKAMESLAKFYLLAGDYPTALKNVNAAFDLDPKNADINALKAAVLMKLNDMKGAKSLAEAALQLAPNHTDASVVLANLLLNQGNVDTATATVDSAIAAHPSTLALYLTKFKIMEKGGDKVAQEALIRTVIKTFPDRKEFQSGLISFLLKNGRAEEAEKELRSNLASHPDDTKIGLDLVKLVMQTKNIAAGSAELEALIKTAKSPIDYQIQLADLNFDSGKKEEAFTLLRKLVEQYGISDQGMTARLNLAEKLVQEKQFVEADSVVSDVLKNDALNVDGLKLSAQLDIEKGNLDNAISTLRQALNNNTSDSSIHVLLASAYERKASFDLAGKELSDTYRSSNADADVGLALANYLIRRGSINRAEETLAEVVSRHPLNKEVLSRLANIKLQRQDWKGAEDLAKLIKSQGGDEVLINQILGASLVGQNRVNDAVSFFQTSAALAPDDVQPMFALVRSLIGAGRIPEAEEFVQSAIKANPDNAVAYILEGVVALAQNKPSLAQKSFETSNAKDPGSPSGYLALAQMYYNQKNLNGAITTLSSSVDKVKENTGVRLALAGLYEAIGNFDDAIKQYEFMVEEDSSSAVAVNNLVSLITDNRDDVSSLKRAADLAIILRDSPIPQFKETLGWALVRNGDAKEGLKILEQTIGDLQNIGAAQYHLGAAYAKVGDKTLASKHLDLALQIEKNPVTLKKIKLIAETL